MKKKYNIFLIGRKNCKYSKSLSFFLKKKVKNLTYLESEISKKINKKFMNKKYDYIFSFRNLDILPKKLLNNCKIAPINFHPGTPKYRGIGCINYAIYEKSKIYGCTAHIMNEKIDNGEILSVKSFRIKKNYDLDKCLKITHKLMYTQAKHVITHLLKNKRNLKKIIARNINVKWSKKIKNRNDLDNFYNIPVKISKSKFKDRLRATVTKNFMPYIKIYGKKFILTNGK